MGERCSVMIQEGDGATRLCRKTEGLVEVVREGVTTRMCAEHADRAVKHFGAALGKGENDGG